MSSIEWQHRIGKSHYRISDIYDGTQNSPRRPIDSKSLLTLSTITAVCPHGGPIATISKRHLFIYTAAFEKIVDTDLEFVTSVMAGLWWSYDASQSPVLSIVLADGTLYSFAVKHRQSLFEKFITRTKIGNFDRDPIVAIGRLESSQVSSFIALTQSMEFFSITNTGCVRINQITNACVVCFAILPGDHIVCALDSGEVVLVGQTAGEPAVCLCHPDSVSAAQMMSVSYTGKYLAIYFGGKEGKVSIFSTADIFTAIEHDHPIRPIDESHVDIGFAPNQLSWVGDDCVAVNFSSKNRNVVFIGGVGGGEWAPYEHEHHTVVTSDLLCATIVTRDKFQIIQRIHPSSLALDNPLESEAKLVKGYLRFLENDVESESTIRSIKSQLEKAVIGCSEAAAFETPIPNITRGKTVEDKIALLLKASAFGRQFIDTATAPAVAANVFVACAGLIRVCADLNERGIPISVPQLLALDPTKTGGKIAVNLLLSVSGDYLSARRIACWLGLDMGEEIFSSFGIDLVDESAHIPDRQLCDDLVSRASQYSLASIAQFAYQMGDRRKLATDLLQHESNLSLQVELLIKLGSDDLALSKALSGNDVDLVHKCLDSLIAKKKSLSEIAGSLEADQLQLLGVLVQYRYYSEKRFEDFCKVTQSISGLEVVNADSALELVFSKWAKGASIPNSKGEEISEWLHFAAERFADCSKTDLVVGGSSVMSPAGSQVAAALLAESSQLLRLQVQLEKTAASKGWPRGPHKFVGLTLDDSLKRLIQIGELQEAEALRTRRKVSDGRYWDLMVRTLIIDANRVEDGIKFVSQSPPPSSDCGGFKTVVECLLACNKEEMALPFIKKLKAKKQAEIFQLIGRHDEARQAAAESVSVVRNVPGVALLGRLASGIIGNK